MHGKVLVIIVSQGMGYWPFRQGFPFSGKLERHLQPQFPSVQRRISPLRVGFQGSSRTSFAPRLSSHLPDPDSYDVNLS